MEKREGLIRVLVFEVDARRFGLFEDDVAKVKRYSDKLVEGRGSGIGDEMVIRSFREYLSLPEELYSNRPFLIQPRDGRELLSVDSIGKVRKVKIYDIFPTRFDYIREAHLDGQRILLFNLKDLLSLDPPFEDDVIGMIHNGGYAPARQPVAEDHGPKSRSDEVEEDERPPERVSKNNSRVGTYALFFLSMVILFLSLFTIIRSEHLGQEPFRLFPAFLRSERGTTAVVSFLTYQTKTTVQTAVLEILRQKKEDLQEVENALSELEKEKSTYLRFADKSETLFEENLSVFDIDESYRWLRSIVDLVRNNVEFKDEAQRRKEQFLRLYEKRRSLLLAEKSDYEVQMAALTNYTETIVQDGPDGRPMDIPHYHGELYLDELKANRLERFFLAIENNDYGGALRALESVSALPSSERERTAVMILSRTLGVLQDYSERLRLLRDNAPFDDIKLSFLNEDYAATRSTLNRLQKEEYLRPLLSGLNGAVSENLEISRKIDDNINLSREVRELARAAALLEKKGDPEKAVQAYENLLLFPLPTYDREFILKKVHSLWIDVELMRIKREENTKAIKYLESARILVKEGNAQEALNYYQLLLSECPRSDFVHDAVREIMALSPSGQNSL